MKDIIKRSIITIVFLVIFIYLVYSFISWNTITNQEYLQLNNTYYYTLMFIALYIAIIHGLYPIHVKFNKAIIFFIWIAMIVVWKTVLNNDWQMWIYFWDFSIVIWVVLTLLAWTNTLTPDKINKKKMSKKVEVIEV